MTDLCPSFLVKTLNSKSALNKLVGHEITHSFEGAKAYPELKNALFAYAKQKGIDIEAEIAAKAKTYTGIKGANAEAELVADLVGRYIFEDYAFVHDLAMNHRNVFQRLYDEIKYLCKLATAGSKEARDLERAKRNFEKAYREGGKAIKNTKYSLEEYTEHQKNNWANSKRIVVYENNAQLEQFIQDSVSQKTLNKKMYFGSISTALASRIQNDTGLNVENYNLSLGSYEIRKILKDHGDAKAEELRGQRAITAEDFSHIVDVVLDPTNIELSDKTYMGKPAIVFTGDYNGRMNVVAVVSDKRLDLFVQTIYANIKKENLSTPIGEQAPINTPEANSGTVFSDNSISQNFEKSTDFSKLSSRDSSGRHLSEGQKEYFAESKVLDKSGNLKVMFHGTHESFTVFDKAKARSGGTYGKGFYFTDSESMTAPYGKAYEVYLNIKNPLQNGTNNITKDQLRSFVEAIAENEDYGLENYGYGATVDSVVDGVWGKSDFAMFLDLNATCIGDMVAAVELFNEVNGTEYDGIIALTETVAFYPNQIKSVDNTTPTADPDMQLSLTENDDLLAPIGRNDVVGEDFRVQEDLAPLPESVRENARFNFGVTQKVIDEYVDDAYENKNEKDYQKYATVSTKLIQDVADEVDIVGYSHALRDNDIRHIRNSHGEGNLSEKYPITRQDIKAIPQIVSEYDKVIVFKKSNGKTGLMYVKVTGDGLVYYLEQITSVYGNEKLLINKQMIKTGINDIPNIKELKSAIAKKESETEFLADLKARQVYAQSVYQSHSKNSIPETMPNVNNNSEKEKYLLGQCRTRFQ